MGWFGKSDVYDRRRILREARDAQRRGRHKRAAELLRRILVVEPECAEIHALLAPSLAARKQTFDAWDSYQRAARAFMNDGRKQQALDLFRDATEKLPRHYASWNARASLERSMGRTSEAKRTFETALPFFRSRKQRPERIALLRQLMSVSPDAADTQLSLAAALAKAGRKHEALHLLTELAKSVEPDALRRIRRCQWEIEPSLTHSWLWLRSAFVR